MDPVTVYLDQKDWITTARARVSRHKIQSRRELEAADDSWEMVVADRVRLPLSCAHLIETARRGVQHDRIDLADVMLAGYGGGHMRHPIDVRGKELSWGLFGRPARSMIRDYLFTAIRGHRSRPRTSSRTHVRGA